MTHRGPRTTPGAAWSRARATLRPGRGADTGGGGDGADTVAAGTAAPAGSEVIGSVDDPAPGQVLWTGGFTARGWTAGAGRPALAVAVRVGEEVVGWAATGTELRPDVAAALGQPALERAGWKVQVPADSVRPGEGDVVVSVWLRPDAPAVDLAPIPVRFSDHAALDGGAGPATGWEVALEEPGAPAPVDGVLLQVRGWALRDRRPPDRIDVLIDGAPAGRARLGLPRPDVELTLGQPGTELSGFEALIDRGAVAVADEELRVELVGYAPGRPGEVIAARTVRTVVAPGAGPHPALRAGPAPAPAPGDGPRTVVFTHTLSLGGAQLWLQELLRRADAGRALGATVVSFGDGPLRPELEAMGIPVHVTTGPPPDDAEAYEGRIAELMPLVAAKGATAALVNTMTAWAGADICRRLGIPVVWGIHESLSPSAFYRAAFGRGAHPHILDCCLASLAAARALVFEAEATRRILAPWTEPGRTVVVPYGVGTAALDRYRDEVSVEATRASLGLPPTARMLLVMATVEPRKGQTVVAEAFARLAGEGADRMLVFVGANETPYSQALRRRVEAGPLASQVRVEPVAADTRPWYRSAEALVLASDLESLPRSAIEAMCLGVPVVASAVFGVPDLVEDGRTGLLFEANDTAACAGALRRWFALSPGERAAMGSAARDHALRHYDSAGYSAEIAALLTAFGSGRDDLPSEILAPAGGEGR